MCWHMSPGLNLHLTAGGRLDGDHQLVAWPPVAREILAQLCGAYANLAREVGLLAALKICGERLHGSIFSQ